MLLPNIEVTIHGHIGITCKKSITYFTQTVLCIKNASFVNIWWQVSASNFTEIFPSKCAYLFFANGTCTCIIVIGSFSKSKVTRYRLGCGPEGGRGIALLFQDLSARRGWVVSITPRSHFTPGKDPVPIVQEAGWAPGPVRTGGKSRPPPGFDPRPARSQSLYRLSYPAHRQLQ